MLNSLSELDFLCQIFLDLDNEDEMKQKLQVLQACIATFLKTSSFERPKTIDIPFRGYISSIQDNVNRTRMGHRRKRPISEIGEGSTPRPLLKRPSHMLVSLSKQKMYSFRKIPKDT